MRPARLVNGAMRDVAREMRAQARAAAAAAKELQAQELAEPNNYRKYVFRTNAQRAIARRETWMAAVRALERMLEASREGED